MHDKIVKCVLAAHNKILQEWKYDKVSSLDMEIRPRNGITSETIVTLLLEIEDEEAAALKLLLHEEDDLYNLETDGYMLSRPVCLYAEHPELLEKALRVYPGLAIYDGTWEIAPAVARYFSEKYGMICL